MAPVTIEGYRLSPQQKVVWSRRRIGAPYKAQCAIRIEGPLSKEVLKDALRKLIERHEILRTTYPRIPGMDIPVQVIAERQDVCYCENDVIGGTRSQLEARVEEAFRSELDRDFDYEHGPLIRFQLLTVSAGDHILIAALSSASVDSRSMTNLAGEIGRCYKSCLENKELPDDVVQYADYSEWLNERLQEKGGGATDHQALNISNNCALVLPLENRTEPVAGPITDWFRIEFDAGLAARIKAAALGEESSTEFFLLACWQVLLWRLTGQSGVTVNYSWDGRRNRRLNQTVGLFARHLPLFCEIQPDFRFAEVLEMAGRSSRGLFTDQDPLSFERDGSSNAETDADLCSSAIGFEYEEYAGELNATGVRFSLLRQDICQAPFKLNLCVHSSGQSLALQWRFDPRRLSMHAVELIARRFEVLLRSAVAEPRRSIADLTIIPDNELDELISRCKGIHIEVSQTLPMHQMFEQQAEANADTLAVVFRDEQLSYAELNHRTNQLAHELMRLGVGPDVTVGICLGRCLETVVAILGVLKAGGAYVPLDPANPYERLNWMVRASGVRVVLSREAELAMLQQCDAPVICLDRDWRRISQNSAANSAGEVRAENLAYEIYTSGTSGQPKGVMIEHGNLANLLESLEPAVYGDGGERRVSVNAPIWFDASVKQVMQVAKGRTLCVIGESTRVDGEEMVRYIEQHMVEVLDSTPGQMRMLLEAGLAACGSLRKVLVGGEAIDKALWQEMSSSTGIRYYNVYGPTECTVDAIVTEVRGTDLRIGVALGNTRVAILDNRGELAPKGVTGEIGIGGANVGRGYRGQCGLTAERYTPECWGGVEGRRLYRTGDLGRVDEQWRIEYLGRMDDQVKLRGYRIELGEIEAVISEHVGVRESVVVLREDKAGDKRLVAYVVPKPGQTTTPNAGADEGASEARRFRTPAIAADLTAAQIIDHMRRRLPDYMVAKAVIFVKDLPLTRNGKVDRAALPQPETTPASLSRGILAARDEIQQLMSELWIELLRRPDISVEDNFFDLGGHSLMATQVISRVRDVFKVDMSLRSLFEEPTVARLSKRVEEALRGGKCSEFGRIEAVERTGGHPLSFGQQRLWFLEQMEPGSGYYNCPGGVRLKGRLNVAGLRAALADLVKRHESLRTVIETVEGRGLQRIVAWEECDLGIPVIDLSEIGEADGVKEGARIAREDAGTGFDLSRPLLRAKVIKVGGDEHLLLFTMHHIICDAWSLGIMVSEIGELYEGYVRGERRELSALPIQYVDYAVWQRKWLTGPVLEQQMEYWRRQLGGEPKVLELATDRPRGRQTSHRGGRVGIRLGRELVQELVGLSRREGVTLYMTVLAAFKVLLNRYSGQKEVTVGTPVAGRTRKETEGLIGFLVNTLVLRSELGADPSVREVVRRVREVVLEAQAHQDVPFEMVVDELQQDRSLNHSPLFQVMLVYQNTPAPILTVPDLELTPMEVSTDTAKFDLTLFIGESEEGLTGSVEYLRDLFDRTSIQRFASHFSALLQAIVDDAGRRISSLPLLTEAEHHQLTLEWNEIEGPHALAEGVHQVIEGQVEQSPDAIAIVSGDEHVTYRQLNDRANQLARHLKTMGIGPESIIAICLERSPRILVAILGALKTGGAFLPVDPDSPKDLLTFILEDSQTRVVLMERTSQQRLPEIDATIVNMDSHWETIGCQSTENLVSTAAADNLAYTIYTSGTTGKPKGVAIHRRGLLHYLNHCVNSYPLGQGKGALLHSSVAFDLSITSVFCPLLVGQSVQVISGDVAASSLSLALSDQGGFSFIKLTPSHLNALAPQLRSERLEQSANLLIVGGEALTAGSLSIWRDHAPATIVINEYGPTETVVGCCAHQLRVKEIDDGQIPIGRPISETQIYLLDSNAQLAPIGAPGELFIGGVGVGRGYLNRPDLTAERFVPNPFNDRPGSLMYRTGDFARLRGDGCIEYLGRVDDQVKIRGFRIELQQIEAVLLQHEAVRDCVVEVRQAESREKRLVAYVVLAELGAVRVDELRRYLQEKLPAYMVPAQFVFLANLPLTPNGKLDRRALPACNHSRPQLDEAFAAPSNFTEQTLARIWSEVLGLDAVGVNDNFFELGGDSILSLQVVARANDAGLALSAKDIFQHQTIAELAGQFFNGRQIASEHGIVTGPVPLTPTQMWWLEQELSKMNCYNQAVMLEVSGELDWSALQRAVNGLMTQHDALRMRYRLTEAGWLQWMPGREGIESPAMVDLSEVRLEEVGELTKLTAEQVRRSLTLEGGPIARFVGMELGKGEASRVLVAIHRMVVDRVSWRVLLEDLNKGYEQAKQAEGVVLGGKTTSFKEWAERLEEYAQTEDLKGQASYWEGAGSWTEDDEGRSNEAGALKGGEGVVVRRLSREETNSLIEMTTDYRSKTEEVLISVLVQSYGKWRGKSRVTVNVEGEGRHEIEPGIDPARTVGWFTTGYPVVLDIGDGNEAVEVLKRVKEQLRQTAARGIEYGLLRYLRKDQTAGRDLRVAPEADFSFCYQPSDADLLTGAHFRLLYKEASRRPKSKRDRSLEFVACLRQEELEFSCFFDEAIHHQQAVERLLQDIVQGLRQLIANGGSSGVTGYTPSDFPLLKIAQGQLDKIVAKTLRAKETLP